MRNNNVAIVRYNFRTNSTKAVTGMYPLKHSNVYHIATNMYTFGINMYL